MTSIDHAYAEEHGLVDAYLKDRLSESERDAFEAHFFDCETCLAQLEMANDFREGMRDVAAEEAAKARLGILAGLTAAALWRRIALGASLLILVAAALVLLIARNRNLERQLAEARSARISVPPPSTPDPRLEAERRALQESVENDLKRLEEELAQARQAAQESLEENRPRVNVPIFMLAAVRSGEEAGREPVNRIPLPTADGPVIFALELATIEFPTYRASLRDGRGKEIWKSQGLQPDDRDTLTILLPSTMLSPGVYELVIEGEGKDVVVGAYPFRVVRP